MVLGLFYVIDRRLIVSTGTSRIFSFVLQIKGNYFTSMSFHRSLGLSRHLFYFRPSHSFCSSYCSHQAISTKLVQNKLFFSCGDNKRCVPKFKHPFDEMIWQHCSITIILGQSMIYAVDEMR